MIDRYNVWARPFALRHMMHRLFRDAFVSPPSERPTQRGGAMDMYEEGENLVVTVQMPGIKPKDVEVTLANGVLTVRGQTTSEDERKDRGYVVREHRTGSFTRQIRVPRELDADAIQATFEHGLLRLTLPKFERPGARRIPITTGASPAIASAPASEPAPAPVIAEATAPAAPDAAAQPATAGKDSARSRKRAGTTEPGPKADGRKSAARKPRARKPEPIPA